MWHTFFSHKNLAVVPEIPASIKDMKYAFRNTSLVAAPEIPYGVTSLYGTFAGCLNLTTAPVIPETVTDMQFTFHNTPLKGTVTINANPTKYDYCFAGVWMYNVTLTGSSTMLNQIGSTGLSYTQQ